MTEPLVLTIEEAAQLLRIGRTKAFEMVARGDLPVLRMGRCVRIPRAALESWIAETAGCTFAGAVDSAGREPRVRPGG